MAPPRLVVATRNDHKLRELRQILAGVELVPLPEDVELPPEDGESFAANAMVKAVAAQEATGLPAIADDSGIEARALRGRPGVRSARYAGPHATDTENLALLIREVAEHDDRGVAYVCALAYVDEAGDRQLFEGRCEGELARDPRGENGFGYDPAFIPRGLDLGDERTMAELSDSEKHEISHRGRAARLLASHLGLPAGTRPRPGSDR
jgi:XTP/dITP diphosphohydrolase